MMLARTICSAVDQPSEVAMNDLPFRLDRTIVIGARCETVFGFFTDDARWAKSRTSSQKKRRATHRRVGHHLS